MSLFKRQTSEEKRREYARKRRTAIETGSYDTSSSFTATTAYDGGGSYDSGSSSSCDTSSSDGGSASCDAGGGF